MRTASGSTTYTYDERNRLDVVRLDGALQADYDYNAVSNLTQTTFGNGTRETRQYDDLHRLKLLENWRGTTKLASYDYTLDKVGNRTQVVEFQNGETRTLKYTYDDLYRLTKEEIDAAGTQNDLVQEYSYDWVGNRTWKRVTANGTTTRTDYTYNANDLLLNERVNGGETASYAYDYNGSTIRKTENGITTTYVWDDEKRMVSAQVGTATSMQYRYNDQGIRVSSTVNGVETRYLLDEGLVAQVWEEYSPTGQAQVAYVHGNDLISQTQQNQTTYYLVDGLGSTRLLTDNQGTILNGYRYDAFGKTLGETGTTDNKYLFAGEQFDTGLGDYYLRQRYYNLDTGRFIRRDEYEGQIEEPLSLNAYLYVEADPINRTDPSGYSDRIGSVGNFVHEYVGAHFLLQNPNFEEGKGRRYDSLFRRYTVGKLLNELNRKTVGVDGNALRPDLIDFDEHVLYEIKPEDYQEDGRRQLTTYLRLINLQLEPWDTKWREGTARTYTPPRTIVVPSAKVVEIDEPENGVITYRVKNDYTGTLLGVTAVTTTTAILLSLLKDALGRRSAVFGF